MAIRRGLFRLSALAPAVLLGACAANGDKPATPAPTADTISFSAGPCFGFCPSYTVKVEPNGSAVLVPERNISVPGETRFTVTTAQYRRLRDGFAAFRPATGKEKRIGPGENCERAATDLPEYAIVWKRAGQDDTKLDFHGGCFDPRYARLRAAIAAVPRVLDIEAMLKPPANPTR